MLVSDKSILNEIHRIKASERVSLSLEALVCLIKMIDIGYLRLVGMLKNKEGIELVSEETLMETWAIVSNLNRLRCILGKISGIKKNNSWFRLISRQIDSVEPSRHFIEHYDRSFESILTDVKPVLGHISWIRPKGEKEIEIQLIIPGRLRLFKGLGAVNPVGKQIRDSVDQITIFLGNNELNISNLYYELSDFVRNLESYISQNYSFN